MTSARAYVVSSLRMIFGVNLLKKRSLKTFSSVLPLLLSLTFARGSEPGAFSRMKGTPRILSIQSTVSHGYVGNKAAVFPLQCMGFNVDSINTVSLSNHPNYSGGFKGQFLSQEEMQAIVGGLQANKLMKYDVIMNGYTRSVSLLEEIAQTVKSVKKENPDALYICDPVLGDNDAYYVPESLLETYQNELLPLAFAITPNYFEAEALTGVKVSTYEDAENACEILHTKYGVKVCVLTGQRISGPQGPQTIIMSVRLNPEAPSFILRSDVSTLPGYFYGCGDLFSALTTCGLYQAMKIYRNNAENSTNLVNLMAEVIEYSTWAMDNVLRETHRHGMKELRIVESIDIYRKLASHWAEKKRKQLGSGVGGSDSADGKGQLKDDGDEGATSASVFTGVTASADAVADIVPRKAHLASAAKSGVVAVIVDMDGTLTEPGAIDFQAMYDRNGWERASGGNILKRIADLATEEERKRAMDIVVDEEVKGCDNMVIREDFTSFLGRVQSSRVRLAMSTRNGPLAVEHFITHAEVPVDTFSPAIHRDSIGGINKPDPEVARHIIRSWGMNGPSDSQVVWFIGDSIDDMTCGHLANCKTCLIRTPFNKNIEDHPHVDLVVDSLSEWTDHVGLK